jgi:hypothetical protein
VRAESPLKFVEISTEPAVVVEQAGERESAIELDIGRVRLRLPERFRPETLARVLEVLEGRS